MFQLGQLATKHLIILTTPNNKAAVGGFVGGGIEDNSPLPEATVTAKSRDNGNGSSGSLSLTFFAGLADFGYNGWERGYDHENYTTTKGIIRPFPSTPFNRWSEQARTYKRNSDFVRGTGFTLSLLSTILTYIAVQKQYNNGGVSNVNAVDFTGLVLGTSGLTTAGLKQSGLSNFPSCQVCIIGYGWIL